MKIMRIINNNIVISDQNKNEVVVMGKAIGFKTKVGEEIDQSKIEKIFSIDNKKTNDRFQLLLETMPLEIVQTVNEIVSYAKLSLGKKISDSIYLSLTDHIHYAIERMEKGYNFKNALSWEVKHFYHHEYLIGKEALEIISRKMNIKLPAEEAIAIALHVVNAEADNSMDNTVGMTRIIKQILNIIQYTFSKNLSEDSLAYERLLTHLKFFVQRIMLGRTLSDDNIELFALIRKSYPKEYECALKIKEYIFKETKHILSIPEMAYITIHINRVINDN